MPVAQNLNLDMAGARHKPFEKYRVIAKGGGGLPPGFFQALGKLAGLLHHAHTAPAAAEGGLNDQRKTNFRRDSGRLLRAAHGLLGTRNHGDAGLLRQAAGGGLVSQQLQQFGAGAYAGNAGMLAGAGECGILRQEPIPGMNRINLLLLGQGKDAVKVQVSFHRPFAGSYQISFVGLEAVQSQTIFLGIDGDRAQPKFVGGAQDADSNFTAVQGKKFLHSCS